MYSNFCHVLSTNCLSFPLVIKASIGVLTTSLSLSGIFSMALNWFRSSLSVRELSARSSEVPLVRKSEEKPSELTNFDNTSADGCAPFFSYLLIGGYSVSPPVLQGRVHYYNCTYKLPKRAFISLGHAFNIFQQL